MLLTSSDRAFTYAEATAVGLKRRELDRLVESGVVTRLFKGLYIDSMLELGPHQRAEALARVVPRTAVVTDRTASWLHGVDLLRYDEQGAPVITMFQIAGNTRLRNQAVKSGTRMFVAKDLMRIGDVTVTTPLRTALDLGRLLRAPDALGAMDGLMRQGTFVREDLERNLSRFKGFRGVIQLRALTPLVDPRSESPAESRLRLEWLESADLPLPELQIPVPNPFSGRPWHLDLGVEELKYALEYDGEEFHSSPEQRRRDGLRRGYLRDEIGWVLDVVRKEDVYDKAANPMAIVREGLSEACRRLGLPSNAWWRLNRTLRGQ